MKNLSNTGDSKMLRFPIVIVITYNKHGHIVKTKLCLDWVDKLKKTFYLCQLHFEK
jgi:hypothetical protein